MRSPNEQLAYITRTADVALPEGELLRQLEVSPTICATLYEPTPALMDEAKQRLSSRNNVMFVESTTVLDNATYDYVFCLEVFEHLPEKETAQALAEIQRLLKPGGWR